MTTAAVILAAGGASRFHQATHKLLTPFRGRPLAQWAIDAVREAAFPAVFIVVGAVDLDHLDLGTEVQLVRNPRWAEGQSTSVQAAIAAAGSSGHDAVVIGLGDQPFVPADAWRAVGGCHDRPIATAVFDGRRRPPVRLAAEVWPLLPTTGDEGARVLLRERPELVAEVPCPGIPVDIDTLEDLHRWS